MTTALTDTDIALRDAAARLEKAIKHVIAGGGDNAWGLVGPCSQIVKLRNGEYRHQNFLGTEKFSLQGAYAGKKGVIILIFSPTTPQTFSKMEMPADKAMTELVGWANILEIAMASTDEEIVLSERELVQNLTKKREVELYDNPIYGSW